MKTRRLSRSVVLLLIFLHAIVAGSGARLSAPGGLSRKGLVPLSPLRRGLRRTRRTEPDTIKVMALRVEFNEGERDTSDATTGTGLFGDFVDKDERKGYETDTIYRYDALPHDSSYFADQLLFAQDYYRTVSRGLLSVEFEIHPAGRSAAFEVPEPMSDYSPGGKRSKESWDDYYYRKSAGLMRFVRDAIAAADSDPDESPFTHLVRDSATGIVRDTLDGRTVVFLIVHAGASYLTDGGRDGFLGQDTPSDMIDAFISPDFFEYYRDTIDLDTVGVAVQGAGGAMLVDEVMMVSETSNQDNLNWGIHGILVNQIARALGIPDLFNTSAGIPGVGSFCIMDFAGYSAGDGFIPPWPSAWVRMIMGWDEPVVATPGVNGTYRITAVSEGDPAGGDTTMLLVPLNDHEYYLIENRQRNLHGSPAVFEYDTTDEDEVYIVGLELDEAVDSSSGRRSNTITRVSNYDVSLPASGVLIWHIDENVIREKIEYNMINADSTYRGVRLVEADGITDLGIQFVDVFYQAAFDYGGAEDVFPHKRVEDNKKAVSIDAIGPFTRPSTSTNDGGRTYLHVKVTPGSGKNGRTEESAIRDYSVVNYVDSVFEVSLRWNTPKAPVDSAASWLRPGYVEGWPKRMPADSAFEPLLCDLFPGNEGRELVVLSRDGKLFVWPSAKEPGPGFGTESDSVLLVDPHALDSARTEIPIPRVPLRFYDLGTSGAIAAMPSSIDNRLYVPAAGRKVVVVDSIDGVDSSLSVREISLGARPSTYVCRSGSWWAIGTVDGSVLFSRTRDDSISHTVRTGSSSAISALAGFGSGGTVAAVQRNGTVSICRPASGAPSREHKVKKGIPPYSLLTGDLEGDGKIEVIVIDSRQGAWCLTEELLPAQGWKDTPIDWASIYNYQENPTEKRRSLPVNTAAGSLGDIDGDGVLDIVLGGANGIFALNYKGVLLKGWPAYLDNRFWYYRGSVRTSPAVVSDRRGEPLVLFSAPTGERETFSFFPIDSTNKENTKVYFTRGEGVPDSIGGLKSSLIDTLLVFGDSLVPDYVLPGGYVDALSSSAKRPVFVDKLRGTGPERQSFWPLTYGGEPATSPLVGDMDGDGTAELFAISLNGWVYRWKIENAVDVDSLFWPQAGYDGGRSFSYLGPDPARRVSDETPLRFFSYPNPTNGASSVQFRFEFGGPARNVRLDIFSYTGNHVYSWKAPSGAYATQWRGANELPEPISLKKFGTGVYRCRMEAKIKGEVHSRYWKMAVVK